MKNLFSIAVLFFLCILSDGSMYSQSWNLTGNSATNATNNFIGTIDSKAFKIRTNNGVRVTVTSSGKVGIGTTSPIFKLDIKNGSINTDSVYRIKGNTVLSVKGSDNVFVGRNCALSNTTGTFNTASGSAALYANEDGDYNSGNGAYALFSNISGSWNTANGSSALYWNTTGSRNSASGTNALYNNTEAFGNTGNGYAALYNNTIGNDNTGIGNFSLGNNTEGFSNTAVGTDAFFSNDLGFSNTALGDHTNTSTGSLSYATAIGAGAVVNSNDKVRLGDAGVGVVEGAVGYSWPSDGRFKDNIKDDVKGLDFIMKLEPVSYNFNRLRYARHTGQHLTAEREKSLIEKSQNRSVGFIAQDVEKIIQQTGFIAFDAVHAPTNETDNYSMGYAEFVVPIVKAVQELNKKNEALNDANEQLKKRIEMLEIKNGIENKNIVKQTNDGGALLEQNNPNPFKENTIIGFYIPELSASALIKIYSMNGEELKSFCISTNGKSHIEISGNTLTPGIYTYVLIVDEKTIDTKQMILTK